ncbi:hypothetical protein H8E65_08960 [Candidatus Bathyarchaeota archaeon]|nr:hypothetical protein [Candidatus Bathyarchaeota archaeon]MBL7080186.1 hypothetical protein [Candidatus Bathyarchaeota archaeon]
MSVMVGECPVYDEGNTKVRRTIGELLNEGDLERRLLKTGILMEDVKRSTQCLKYDPEAETCRECRDRNRWRRDVLESAIRIDLKLSKAISRLGVIVDGLQSP